MSLLRCAARALRPSCSARPFSISTPGPTKPSSSNLPLYFGGAGLVGLATYVYLGGSAASFSTTTATTTTSTTKPKAEKKPALDPERFLDLKLKAIEPYNHNTSRFVFELPDGGAALSPITSLVVVRASEGAKDAPLDKKGNPVIRPYTPISPPDHEGELVLLVKKYESGVMSKYVHERLKPGSTLSIKGPINKFPYKGLSVYSLFSSTLIFIKQTKRERIRARRADRRRLRHHPTLPAAQPRTGGPHKPHALHAALRQRHRDGHTPARRAQCARARTPTDPTCRAYARQTPSRLGRRIWLCQPRAHQSACRASRARRKSQGVRLWCVTPDCVCDLPRCVLTNRCFVSLREQVLRGRSRLSQEKSKG